MSYIASDISLGIKYRVLRTLLMLTGICFRRYRSEQSITERFIRILFAILYILLGKDGTHSNEKRYFLVFYVTSCILLEVAVVFEEGSDVLIIALLALWMLYAIFIMVFHSF